MADSPRVMSTSVLRKRARDRARMRARRDEGAQRFGARIDRDKVLKQLCFVSRRRLTLEALLPRLLEYQSSVKLLEATIRQALDLPHILSAEIVDLPSLHDAKAAVFGHEFDRGLLNGTIRFPFLEASIEGAGGPSPALRTKDAPTDQESGSGPVRAVDAWINGRIETLVPIPADTPTFRADFLQFSAPVYSGGPKVAEGIQTDQGVMPALAPRDRTDEPVQVLIGVPGSGKTHRALEMMSRRKGRIHAFSPTPGSREQVRQLADKLGLIDRVKVVEKIGDLRRRSRVLIDEASVVKPGILHYLRDATDLYLTGDAGQSAAKPGESLLGALAALGAPVIELTESLRTSSPAIKLLGQFVSSTQKPVIPEIERVVAEKAVSLVNCRDGDDFDAICAEAAKHADCMAIVWSRELQEQLSAAGIRAYQSNLALGSEAEHVIVHMPAEWADPAKKPAPPFISFLNGVCRAREGATIVASAVFDAIFYSNSFLRQRANDLQTVVDLACDDPRLPNKNPLNRWSAQRWWLCEVVLDTFNEGYWDADLVGDWLFAYRRSNPTRYCGAAMIGPGKLGVTEEMVLARGFPWAESFDSPLGEEPDSAEHDIRVRLVARMVPNRLRT